ncbi:hypothetical protein M9434_005982 [Picochlorum sp. BPE23]|nr:hypothetical protein M9434_005982 [Picochlorum sp. BPE23]
MEVNSFRAAEYYVWVLSGLLVALCMGVLVYTLVPFSLSFSCANGTRRSARGRWYGAVLCALLAAVQILRLNVIWGPYSVVAPSKVTSWTSQGWMCRVYLTVCLGLLFPLCQTMVTIFFFRALCRHEYRQHTFASAIKVIGTNLEDEKRPSWRSKAAVAIASGQLAVVIGLQSVAAWISLAVSYDGRPVEDSPTSVLGYFIGTYRIGSPSQCGLEPCTACVFPAASAIVHCIFCALYVFQMWRLVWKLKNIVTNIILRRKLVWYATCATALLVGGAGCLAASVPFSPFGWVNQGLWLGFFSTVAGSIVAICFAWVIRPLYERRLAMLTLSHPQDDGHLCSGRDYGTPDSATSVGGKDALSHTDTPTTKKLESTDSEYTPAQDVLLRPGEVPRQAGDDHVVVDLHRAAFSHDNDGELVSRRISPKHTRQRTPLYGQALHVRGLSIGSAHSNGSSVHSGFSFTAGPSDQDKTSSPITKTASSVQQQRYSFRFG